MNGFSLRIRVEQRLGPLLGEMANIFLAAHRITSPPTAGVNWLSNFIKRRDELRTRFSRRYEYKRALNEDPKSLREWFATVERLSIRTVSTIPA